MEIQVKLPPFIALCGHPGSGKTTAAEIICEAFECEILDTGGPLREIAMNYLGLTRQQVYTQESKASIVQVNGVEWPVRKILGDLGKQLEDMFGEEVMPFMSHQLIQRRLTKVFDENDMPTFVDPSCRKIQAHYWKRHGGLVIGINNPLAGPSPYDFDKFDETAVDVWIENDGLARGMEPHEALRDLEGKVVNTILQWVIEKSFKAAFAA